MEQPLLEIGILGILLWLTIKELFSIIKAKRNGVNGSVNQQLLRVITEQNDNHLHTIQDTMNVISKDINNGNDRMVDAIKDMHIDLATKLGELKGKMDK